MIVTDPRVDVVATGLQDLAELHGVATGYTDQSGVPVTIAPDTVVAILAALGVDASTPSAVQESITRAITDPWRRILPPVHVARQGFSGAVLVHVPHGSPVRLRIEFDEGGGGDLDQIDHWVEPQLIDGSLIGEAAFAVPADLPLGWHRVIAEGPGLSATMPLVMTPHRLDPPALRHGRIWGLMAHIYATRSQRSWGIGDLRDLADLAAWSGHELGADYILVNPMHAASPVPPVTPSPYLPVTRRFASPLYLRIEDIPEYSYLSGKDRGRIRDLSRAVRRSSRTRDLIDRDAAWSAKEQALRLIHSRGLTPGRRAEYAAYCASEEPGLTDFATWCALTEEHGPQWPQWPEEFHDPAGPAVSGFRDAHPGQVDFHRWQQWLLDEQLRTAASVARDAGMRGGIVHDLAVGVHPEGADAWALRSVLATGFCVGCPPDMYNQQGQDWSQPPWHPSALRDAAYLPFRDMVRTVLRRAGGLRIDHVLGLFRLWWVPQGGSPTQGGYVRYDHEALLGILALEAHRAGALVVGEDLGTVDPWIQEVLVERGFLGTSVLWFERGEGGRIRPPQDWRDSILASVTVHDLPPTAGYLEGEQIRIRDELGLLTVPVEQERAAAEREWQEWESLLVRRGWLSGPDAPMADRVRALHRAVAASPARMIGIWLPDITGDRTALNQPGTDQEYPNWRVPLGDAEGAPVLLDDLMDLPFARDLVEAVGGRPRIAD